MSCRPVTLTHSLLLVLRRCFLAGYWNVIVYGRKHSYRLYCKLLNEATRWASSIQNVIDTKVPMDTPTQQLIQDIRVGRRLLSETEAGFRVFKGTF